MSNAEQTIKRLVRTMTTSELLNINTMVVSRIRILRAKKLKEKKDMLKIGDKVTFKVTKSPSYVLKCRGWNVGVVRSIARSNAQVRVGSKTFKCRIRGLEKTNHEEGSWFEKPRLWIGKHNSAWPTLIELTSKDALN
jgi:hypothetical protein